MTKRTFKVLIEWDAEEQVWLTSVPALDGLSTYGETREDAIKQTQEAILGYLEAAEREGLPVPAGSAEIELVDVEVAIA
jgi:predicted RNase H-like HicB family nuclease